MLYSGELAAAHPAFTIPEAIQEGELFTAPMQLQRVSIKNIIRVAVCEHLHQYLFVFLMNVWAAG